MPIPFAFGLLDEDGRVLNDTELLMLEEAEQLMEGDKKYDHPNLGSKDTADSAAGALYDAISSEERTALLTEANPSIRTIILPRG